MQCSKAAHALSAIEANQVATALITGATSGIVPIRADVTDRAGLDAIVAGRHIDVLINNAGIMPPLRNFAEMAMSDIDATLETNLTAAIVLTRLVAPRMRARQSGHILFTGSSAGHAALPDIAVYAATKAALSGFAASLRADLSPFGVRVTEIVPGRVETGLYKNILDAEACAAMYAGNAAVQPQDVAKMVAALLALPPSAAVTRLDVMPTRPAGPAGAR